MGKISRDSDKDVIRVEWKKLKRFPREFVG